MGCGGGGGSSEAGVTCTVSLACCIASSIEDCKLPLSQAHQSGRKREEQEVLEVEEVEEKGGEGRKREEEGGAGG